MWAMHVHVYTYVSMHVVTLTKIIVYEVITSILIYLSSTHACSACLLQSVSRQYYHSSLTREFCKINKSRKHLTHVQRTACISEAILVHAGTYRDHWNHLLSTLSAITTLSLNKQENTQNVNVYICIRCEVCFKYLHKVQSKGRKKTYVR